MTELHKLWQDIYKAKGNIAAKVRRSRIVNPVAYAFYCLTGTLYLLYSYYDLLADAFAVPAWLPLGWLRDFVHGIPLPNWLTAALFFALPPMLVGVILKTVIRIPKTAEIPAAPQKEWKLRNGIRAVGEEITALSKSAKYPIAFCGIGILIGIVFAVVCGLLAGLWWKAILRTLLVAFVFIVSELMLEFYGYDSAELSADLKAKIEENEKTCLEHEKQTAWKDCVDRCLAAIRNGMYDEALQLVEPYVADKKFSDAAYLQKLLKGTTGSKEAARILHEISFDEGYRTPVLQEAYKLTQEKLTKLAQSYYKSSKKETEKHLRNQEWEEGFSSSLYGYKTSPDFSVMHYYCVLRYRTLAPQDLEFYAKKLNEAYDQGLSGEGLVWYYEAWNYLEIYRQAFRETYARKTTEAHTGDPSDDFWDDQYEKNLKNDGIISMNYSTDM